MSLSVGDHLVIKRDGKILTPDAGEAYHEYEVKEVGLSEFKDGKVIYKPTIEMVK